MRCLPSLRSIDSILWGPILLCCLVPPAPFACIASPIPLPINPHTTHTNRRNGPPMRRQQQQRRLMRAALFLLVVGGAAAFLTPAAMTPAAAAAATTTSTSKRQDAAMTVAHAAAGAFLVGWGWDGMDRSNKQRMTTLSGPDTSLLLSCAPSPQINKTHTWHRRRERPPPRWLGPGQNLHPAPDHRPLWRAGPADCELLREAAQP